MLFGLKGFYSFPSFTLFECPGTVKRNSLLFTVIGKTQHSSRMKWTVLKKTDSHALFPFSLMNILSQDHFSSDTKTQVCQRLQGLWCHCFCGQEKKGEMRRVSSPWPVLVLEPNTLVGGLGLGDRERGQPWQRHDLLSSWLFHHRLVMIHVT